MKRVLLISLAVIGALALICGGGLTILGIWLGSKVGDPEGITVRIDQPAAIHVGDTFTITVEIINALPRERELKDIDFYDPLLEGAKLVRVEPVHAGFDTSLGMATFTMNHAIPASGSLAVAITLTAETPGTYSGDLDVSVDSIMSLKSTPHTIVIQPKP